MLAGLCRRPMCAQCYMGEGAVPTHYRDTTGACVPCEKVGVKWLQFIATLLVFPLIVLAIFACVRRCRKQKDIKVKKRLKVWWIVGYCYVRRLTVRHRLCCRASVSCRVGAVMR